MSDQPPEPGPKAAAATDRPTTAGGILRQARQAQGLHIAALAAAIKVVPRKLELLESDQYDQLPDATFTRALAQTVCRSLKIDAAPVLALLPPLSGPRRLEEVAEGLNTPFRDSPGRSVSRDRASIASPVLWIAALIVVLTVAVYAVPSSWLASFSLAGLTRAHPSSDTPADAASAAASAATTTSTTTIVDPTPAAAAATAASAALPDAVPASAAAQESAAAPDAVTAAAASGMLQFRTTAQSWVEAVDSRGTSLVSRLMMPGESLGVDGVPPLKIKIGNVKGTELVFKGQPVDLASYTRDNVARFVLK